MELSGLSKVRSFKLNKAVFCLHSPFKRSWKATTFQQKQVTRPILPHSARFPKNADICQHVLNAIVFSFHCNVANAQAYHLIGTQG